jgi:hypothetical protein
MITPLSAVLMTAIASTLASTPPADAPAPAAFEARDQGFRASFPTPPQVIGHAPASDDDSGYWIYADRSNGTAYTVRIDQYPNSIRVPAPDQRAYDQLLRAHAVESSSHLQAEKRVGVGGLAGLEGDFVGENGAGEHVRVVMVGRRVYQVSYAAAASDGGEQGDAFLASFQINPR